MKEKVVSVLETVLSGFSIKFFVITFLSTLLTISVRHPKISKWNRIAFAGLCGVISGFVTSEVAKLLDMEQVAENTISAVLGICLFEFVKSYMDKLVNKYTNEKH